MKRISWYVRWMLLPEVSTATPDLGACVLRQYRTDPQFSSKCHTAGSRGWAVFVLVSDHGFVPVEKTVHPPVGKATPFWVTAADPQEAAELERLSGDPANGIGRRIPPEEWTRFLPGTPQPAAAWEPADLFLFSPTPVEGRYGKPHEVGTHGLWPGRPGYRSVFLVRGPGIEAGRTAEMPMTGIYGRLKSLLIKSGQR